MHTHALQRVDNKAIGIAIGIAVALRAHRTEVPAGRRWQARHTAAREAPRRTAAAPAAGAGAAAAAVRRTRPRHHTAAQGHLRAQPYR